MDYRFDTIALVVSQHYRLLRSIVTTSAGLRMPTSDEAQMADYLTDVIESVAGRRLANYCRERFRQGWLTRDLRSYKIKFVLTRLRDALSKSAARDELQQRLTALTDVAEKLAGCTSDNKRRNRKAVEAQLQRRQEKEAQQAQEESSRPQQLMLFSEADLSGSSDETTLEEDILDDVDLLVVPIKNIKKQEENTVKYDIPAEKKDTKKKSRADRRFEKIAQEILRSEYADEDEEYTRDTDVSGAPEDDLQDIERSYGVYYDKNTCTWDETTDLEPEERDEEDNDV